MRLFFAGFVAYARRLLRPAKEPMNSVAGIAITSFLVGLSGAMMPGPVLTVTIGETAARLRPDDWYGSMSLALAMGRRLLTDRTYRGLVTTCAVLLLGFSLYFGDAGVHHLLT